MAEEHGKLIYRPKRWFRWLMVGLMAVVCAYWLGLAAFLLVKVGPHFADMLEVLGEDVGRYLQFAAFAMALMTLITAVSTTFVARYWWTYRVELDDKGIARKGLPNLISPRFSIAFQDIERIAAGSRYTLRIIPRKGKVAVLNVKLVEDGLPGLVSELRKRLDPDKVQSDLESALAAKRTPDRLEAIAAAGGGAVLILLFLSIAFGRQIKTLFGWQPLIGWNTKVLALAVAPDGALWALTEGDRGPGLLGIRLHQAGADESSEVDLPVAEEAPGNGQVFDGFLNPVRSMAVDGLGQTWMVSRHGDQVSRWDGTGWQSYEIPNFGDDPDIREVALLDGQIWGFSRQARAGFSIDSQTGEVVVFEFVRPDQESSSTLRLNPTNFHPTANGGLIILGVTQAGKPGIIHMTPEATIDIMTSLEGSVDLPDSTWSLEFGSADSENNLFAIFTSPTSCSSMTYQVIVGYFDRASADWSTLRLLRDLDCSKYWSLPSFAVDPRGRIWVAMDAQEAGGVMVYDPSQRAIGGVETIEAMRQYTEENSNYNGNPIDSSRGGVIYTVDQYGGKAAAIDGSAAELPDPLPPSLALLWERPYYIYGPYLALMLFLSVRSVQQNRSRDYGASTVKSEETGPNASEEGSRELIFRQSPRYQRAPLYVAILVPSVIIAGFITMPLLVGGTLSDIADFMAWPFGLIWLAMPLLLGATLGYWALFASKDRLVISQTQIERRGLHHFRIYRGPVRFEDVIKVRRGAQGVVVIERDQGRKFEIAPKAYEGGADVILLELRKKIGSDRFEAGLEQRLFQRTGAWYRALIFFVAGGLLYLFGLFHDDIIDRVQRNLAWKTEVKAERLRESLEDFALQDDGSLWLLVRKGFGDYEDPRNYEARHLTASDIDILGFPALEVLYPQGPPEMGGSHPEGIAVTDEGIPRVYFFLVDPALVWTGTRWEWEAEPVLAGGETYLDRLLRGTHGDYWQTVISTRRIQATIPSLGAVEEIDLGPESEKYAFVVLAEPRGWTIARYRSPDRRFFLLPFRDDPAEGHWVEVEVAGLPPSEYWDLTDYTVGPTGSLYALMRPLDYCQEGVVTLLVAELEGEGNTGWTWRAFSYPQDCDHTGDPREFVVDASGRVLIQGWDQVAVYDASVFDKPQADPEDLTLYTEGNSGFYSSHRLEVGPDGRIWSLDIGGDALVWFDPNVEELPKPLPPWVGALYESFWTPMVFILAGSGLYGVGIILARNEGRLRRRKSDG